MLIYNLLLTTSCQVSRGKSWQAYLVKQIMRKNAREK